MGDKNPVTGTVVEVLPAARSDTGQYFFWLATDDGKKMIWVSDYPDHLRVGHRITVFPEEVALPPFLGVWASRALTIRHDTPPLQDWFLTDTGLALLERILAEPEKTLPRQVLADYLAQVIPFEEARLLGTMLHASLGSPGVFYAPLAAREKLLPFTCAWAGLPFGRDPLFSEFPVANRWMELARTFGEPVRTLPLGRPSVGNRFRDYRDLWRWVRKEVCDFQRTNLLVPGIFYREDRPRFGTDWTEFLKTLDIHMAALMVDSVNYNPPLGFHTKMGYREAAAYLDISIAELRRLEQSGAIPASDGVFEHMDLESFMESRWIVDA